MWLKNKRLPSQQLAEFLRALSRHNSAQRSYLMRRTERIRQSASSELTWNEIQKLQSQGWRLIALEWERDVPEVGKNAGEEDTREHPPFGLRVANDCSTLVEDHNENEALIAMMELVIQDGPYSSIAEELNRRGYRTRQGLKWSPVSVFEMLPRLIDAGPRILSSKNWHRRKQEYQRGTTPPIV
jgi:Recombinase